MQQCVAESLKCRLYFKLKALCLYDITYMFIHFNSIHFAVSSIQINCMTTRSHSKFRICTTTNDLTLYSFSSLYIFVTGGWPTVAETCRQPNKTDTKDSCVLTYQPPPNLRSTGTLQGPLIVKRKMVFEILNAVILFLVRTVAYVCCELVVQRSSYMLVVIYGTFQQLKSTRFGVRSESRNFSLLRNAQTGSESHPFSYH